MFLFAAPLSAGLSFVDQPAANADAQPTAPTIELPDGLSKLAKEQMPKLSLLQKKTSDAYKHTVKPQLRQQAESATRATGTSPNLELSHKQQKQLEQHKYEPPSAKKDLADAKSAATGAFSTLLDAWDAKASSGKKAPSLEAMRAMIRDPLLPDSEKMRRYRAASPDEKRVMLEAMQLEGKAPPRGR